MNNLRDIRRRLRTAENIKKITDAMERVAAAKLRRAQETAESSRPYAKKMKEMVEKLTMTSEFPNPLFENRGGTNRALIVISADKGLSGPYNNNIFQAVDKFLNTYSQDNTHLLLFGKKAIDYYQKKGLPISFKRMDWAGKIQLREIEECVDKVVTDFLDKKYDEIWLIYTHYVSISTREVMLSKFLPIEKAKKGSIEEEQLNYIFEPIAEDIISELLPRYCAIRVKEALNESYASELGARIMAMQMASKNSQEMMQALTLIRNRVRQEGITREMIEISSAME